MRSKDRALLRNLVLASIAGTVGSLAIAASCLSGAKVDGVAASSSDAITETVSSRNGGAPTTQPVALSGGANAASTEASNGSVRSSAGGIASSDTAGLTTTTGAEVPVASLQPPEGQGPAIAADAGAFGLPENPIRALPPAIATPTVAPGQTPAAPPTSPTANGEDDPAARVSRPEDTPNQSVAPTNDMRAGGGADGGSSALTRDPRVAAPPPTATSTSPFATDAPPWATSSWTSNPEAGAGRFTTEWNIPGGFTPALPIIPLTDIR